MIAASSLALNYSSMVDGLKFRDHRLSFYERYVYINIVGIKEAKYGHNAGRRDVCRYMYMR